MYHVHHQSKKKNYNKSVEAAGLFIYHNDKKDVFRNLDKASYEVTSQTQLLVILIVRQLTDY